MFIVKVNIVLIINFLVVSGSLIFRKVFYFFVLRLSVVFLRFGFIFFRVVEME